VDALVHRPVGDLLEEVLSRGPARFPPYLEPLPGAPVSYRIAALLGALSLGPAAEEEVRERLTQRDSAGKARLVMGLAELGHPLAEGHLARILRERASEEAAGAALRGLGRIRGDRSLPLLRPFLDHPSLAPAACEALAAYGGEEARRELMARAAEFPAFRALAELGAPEARGLFIDALGRGEPWDAEGARALGRIGDPDLGALLVPLLEGGAAELERAAFETYARLGAPQGAEPLLSVARRNLEPWMIAAFASVDDAGVHQFVLDSLQSAPAAGFLGRLFRRRRPSPVEPKSACRALRGASEPQVVGALLERLRVSAVGVGEAREILQNHALLTQARYAEALLPLWRKGDLPVRYLAARALLQVPTETFLGEAMDLLARPGFVPLDGAPMGSDAERMLEGYARDNNPCLLLGGFVDSDLVEPTGLAEALRKRFVGHEFPRDLAPEARFSGLGEQEIGTFLGALTRVNPATAEALARLWNLLDGLEDRGERLLDLFLIWTGVQRGAIQRVIVQGMPAALGRFVQGKGDRCLPQLDAVGDRAPADGPLARPLREALEVARRTLKAECRDMALLLEGRPQRGDMVLVEEL